MGLGLGMAAGALGDSLFSIGKYLYQQQRDDEEKARQALEQQRLDAELYYRTGYMRGNGPAPSAPSAPLKGAISSSPIPGPTPRAPVAQDFFGSYAPGQGPGQVPVPKLLAPNVGPDVSAPIAPPPAAQRQMQAPVGRPAPPGFMKAGLGAVEQARAEADAEQLAAGRAAATADPEWAAFTPEQQQAILSNRTTLAAVKGALARRTAHTRAEANRKAYGNRLTTGADDTQTNEEAAKLYSSDLNIREARARERATGAGNPPSRVLAGLNAQISTTERDLAAAQKQLPDPDSYARAANPHAFDETEQRVGLLGDRLDSLSQKRDSVVASLQGATVPGTRQPTGPTLGTLLSGAPVPPPIPAHAASPFDLGAGRRNGSAKRIITQDQKDYLVARGTWDANLYEVR